MQQQKHTEQIEPVDDFAVLYRERYRPMAKLAFSLLNNAAEAEEVTQDAFTDVYRRWKSLLNPPGYLRIAVINGARRTLRRRIHRDDLHQRIGAGTQQTTSASEYLLDSLDSLPEKQRTAVILAYYERMTSVEIAEALDCPVGTAKSLVHRGIKNLRKEIAND